MARPLRWGGRRGLRGGGRADLSSGRGYPLTFLFWESDMVRKLMPYVGVVLAIVCFAGAAYAMQEDPGVDQAVTKKSWFDLFRSTGFVGILLVATSMIGTALLIQFMVTMSESKLENHAVLAEVENLLSQGQVDEAYQIASEDKSYSSRLIAGALARSFGGFEETKKG